MDDGGIHHRPLRSSRSFSSQYCSTALKISSAK